MIRIITYIIFSVALSLFYGCVVGLSGTSISDEPFERRSVRLSVEDRDFNKEIGSSANFANPEEIPSPQKVGNSMDADPIEVDVLDANGRRPSGSDTVEYTCDQQDFEFAPGYSNIALVEASEILYPGALFKGSSIQSGEYAPIVVKRKPLNVSISILGVEEVAAATVYDLSLASFRTASFRFFTEMNLGNTQPPANQVFTISSVHSNDQFTSSLGIGINAQRSPEAALGKATGSATITTATGTEKQQYFARYVHQYFTIDVDIPGRPSDFFEEYPELDEDESPVYVSSVVYGRQIFFDIDSHRTTMELQSTLTASASAANQDNNKNGGLQNQLDTNTKKVITNSTITGTVRGGSQSACGTIGAGENGNGTEQINQFEKCLREGGNNYLDAVPIAYRLRYLRDNTLARVVFDKHEYTARSCRKTGGTMEQVYSISRLRSSNNDHCCDRALEINWGVIGLQPTSDRVGAGVYCDPYYNIGISRFGVNNSKRLFQIPRGSKEKYNDSWHNVLGRNLQATVTSNNSDPNLIICGLFTEDGGSRSDRSFGQRQVISKNDRQLTQPYGKTIRFQGQSNLWLEFSVHKNN